MTKGYNREPYPHRTLDDVGMSFAMGAVGGSVYHFFQGMKNSPRGDQLLGGVQGVRMKVPGLAGRFAVWGGLFSVLDCIMVYVRQREDPWNLIAAGAATGGFLRLRAGMRASARSALLGGVILGAIEGTNLVLNRASTWYLEHPAPALEALPQIAGKPSGPYAGYAGFGGPSPGAIPRSYLEQNSGAKPETSSFFGTWFGGKKEEAHPVRTEKLDSFDANPAPPTPEFKMR